MPRKLSTKQARDLAAQRSNPGRKRGVLMPCGWKCGAKLTAREMRQHFTDCPRRPKQ